MLSRSRPTCWAAFFESYVRDITHVRPLHPDTLQFLLVAHGFQQVEVRYRSPYPERAGLFREIVVEWSTALGPDGRRDRWEIRLTESPRR